MDEIIELSKHFNRFDRYYLTQILDKVLELSNEPGVNVHDFREILQKFNEEIKESL